MTNFKVGRKLYIIRNQNILSSAWELMKQMLVLRPLPGQIPADDCQTQHFIPPPSGHADRVRRPHLHAPSLWAHFATQLCFHAQADSGDNWKHVKTIGAYRPH